MDPLTEQQLRSSLVNASADLAAEMTMPGLHEIMWDQRDYLGWHDTRAPRRAYLAYWRDGEPLTLLLQVPSRAGRPDRLAICSFCGIQQPINQVLLFTAPRSGASGEKGDTVGTYICDDFSCSLSIRHTRPHDLQANIGEFVRSRIDTLQRRLDGFVGHVLAE